MSGIIDGTSGTSGGDRARASWRFLKTHLREYGILFALIAIMAFFQIATGGILLKPLNLTNLVLQNSYIVIMAIGMLLVIVAGHIDLSVGSVLGFIGALAAVMIVNWDMPYFLAGLLCLGVGALIGMAQGFWVAYFRIPVLHRDAGGHARLQGPDALAPGRAVGRPLPAAIPADLLGLPARPLRHGRDEPHVVPDRRWRLPRASPLSRSATARRRPRTGAADEPFAFFAAKTAIVFFGIVWMSWLMADFRGLPNVFIVMALLIAIYCFVTSRTTIGRRIYAIGGNEKAATLSGINSKRLTFLTFANMGMLAALAGLVFAARLNTATPKAGATFELDVIAAVFIGGASMAGGVGTVVGAVVGAFIMGVMNNGMSILGIGIDYQQVIKGLVLLAAVIFDVVNKKKG